MSIAVPNIPTRSHDDMVAEAKAARLKHTSDDDAGYSRVRVDDGFEYRGPDGKRVKDEALIERFDSMAIPPAWTDVWICKSPRGHLQVTGRDDADRKQYIYHEKWEEYRARSRYRKIEEFGRRLPELRERIDSDLRKREPCRTRTVALACAILDTTFMRVGQEAYERENGSYGLTTLRRDHAEIGAVRVTFEYIGKSGAERKVQFSDRRLAGHLAKLQELESDRVLCYQRGDGVFGVKPSAINEYIREVLGEGFSAKDFRTWGGCLRCFEALVDAEVPLDEKECHQRVVDAVKCTATTLGNTPAVCRSHYIHVEILDFAEDVDRWSLLQKARDANRDGGRRAREELVLDVLAQLH